MLEKKDAKKIPAPDPVVVPFQGKKISVCQPTLQGNERRYVMECLEKNWISSHGDFVLRFEEAFAKKVGAKHGVASSSGTAALHMALAALNLNPKDEVILPAFTMIATINAVIFVGAKPVLVDAEPQTWNMDVEQIAKKITRRTKVILPVHIYGHPCEMDAILELARQHHLHIVEDAAEAHGACYRDKRVGSLGTAGAFSFFANKLITAGEGGMVVTNDQKIAEHAQGFRNFAFSKEIHFWHQFIGCNYRITNLQAAIGLAQVEQLDKFVEARRKNAKLYTSYLQKIPGITTPAESPKVKNVYWMYGILVDKPYPLTRDGLRCHLARHGIETRSFFIPLHWQRPYQKMFWGEKYPVAEELCAKGCYLPSSSSLTEEDTQYISEVIAHPEGQ